MNVSVVIPAYNEDQYIETCLEHLINQTQKPLEIIVVNNNSTDKTVEIVKKFPVTLIHEPVQGMIPTRNKGFNAAKGDIIARTDADSRVPSDWVSLIQQNFEQTDIVALSGPVTFYDLPIHSKVFSNVFSETLKLLFKQNFLYGPNYALKKDTWNTIKNEVCLKDSEVHEDFDVSIHIPTPELIGFDPNLVVEISARRIKHHPESFFGEYLLRAIKMMKNHNKNFLL